MGFLPVTPGKLLWEVLLAEDKEGTDVPEKGLLLEEGFQVDVLKGLEAANQGDKGLIVCVVCDALEDGHHGGQASACSQHEELTVLVWLINEASKRSSPESCVSCSPGLDIPGHQPSRVALD